MDIPRRSRTGSETIHLLDSWTCQYSCLRVAIWVRVPILWCSRRASYSHCIAAPLTSCAYLKKAHPAAEGQQRIGGDSDTIIAIVSRYPYDTFLVRVLPYEEFSPITMSNYFQV